MLIDSKRFKRFTLFLVATSASIIACDIFFSFYPFPSTLRELYLLNFILFPYAITWIFITISFRWKRRILIGMAALALLSLPSFTYSKIGMYSYFKIHSKEFTRITEVMKVHGIKSINMSYFPIYRLYCYRNESHRVATNESSACIAEIANDTAIIAKNMRNLSIPSIKTHSEVIEFKINNLKRGRVWFYQGSSENDQKLLSESYIQITEDQFLYYPK
jgi:hypothetical protein